MFIMKFASATKSSSVYLKCRLSMAKSFLGVIMEGSRICWNALYRSIKEEIELSQQAAKARYSNPDNVKRRSFIRNQAMSLDEAMKILNVKELEHSVIDKQYKYLLNVNKKEKGGSFYLQSKIFRAKQRIDQELKKQMDKQNEDVNV